MLYYKHTEMNINKLIEHTLLRPDAKLSEIKELCDEAILHKFYGVCVPPYFVKDAVRFLNEQAKVISVIGFPMGYSTIPAKVEEVKKALDEGANEVDAVVNLCAVKSGNWNYVKSEMDSVVRAAMMRGKIIKIIVETGLLTRDELRLLLPICEGQDVQFIKTSTGVNAAGATVDDVKFIRQNLRAGIKIKASGGIRTLDQMERLLVAGADRIGTSTGVAIVEAFKQRKL
jgi:deoxyribose-phosphate aldolase